MLKIQPIKFNSVYMGNAKNFKKKSDFEQRKYVSFLSFCNANFVSNIGNPLPKELSGQFDKNYTTAQMISDSIQEENIIGSGANSIVYAIPNSDDYVLKVLNKHDPNKVPLDEFPSSVNLGQPVWYDKTNPRIMILKKIKGEENSIPNWSKTIYNPETQSAQEVTGEQAQIYLSKVKTIASMPLESFEDLAQKVVLLEDKGYKLDSINPNNLLVNPDNDEINVIDYFKIPEYDKDKKVYENSYLDMVALALDFTLLPEFFDKLTDSEQDELCECAEKTNSKAYIGAKNAGVSCDSEKFKKFIYYTVQWFVPLDCGKYVRAYEKRADDFMEMLNNPKSWAENRKI